MGCETIYAFIYRAAQKAEQVWRYLHAPPVILQKQDRGDPDPHRSDRGYLRGRRLRRKSRFLVPRISNFDAGIRAAPFPRRRARAEETFKARAQPFGIARFAFPNDQNMPTVRF